MEEQATQAPAITAEELADLKSKVTELEGKAAQVEDLKRTAEFWHGKATAGSAAKKPADEVADEDEADLLDIITSKGAKGLDDLLRKRGFVSAAEVTTMVDSKAKQIEAESQLVKDFPELKDQNSEFFKSTAALFGTLKAEGVPEARAMVTAAKETALDFIRAGKMKTPQQLTEEGKAAKETARLARIAAQGGERGSRNAPNEDEGDGELDEQQTRIAVRMLEGTPGKDGKPRTRDEAIAVYKERASKGVAMSTKNR